MRTNHFVAMKVIRSHSSYTHQAKQEIDILAQLNTEDRDDSCGISKNNLNNYLN